MSDKIFIGTLSKGLSKFLLPFNIDNESFATLLNAYTWRGRVRRKRGTIPLGRLQRQVDSVLNSTPPASWQYGQIVTLDGSGNGTANLISVFSLDSTGSVVPGSIHLTDGTNTYTDPAPQLGLLTGTPAGSGTINYATGAITITGGAPGGILRGVTTAGIASYSYFTDLPVMGLRDFIVTSSQYPSLIAFDTKYSYQIVDNTRTFFNTSYYKYTNNPVTWSGQNYQQFWTTNYQGALWATNNVPGFNFLPLTNVLGVSITQTSATTVDVNLTNNRLILGDLVFFNEVTGTIATGTGTTANQNINLQTGRVTTVGTNTFTATFDGTLGSTLANFQAAATGAGGITQYLTSGVLGLGDGIRWYDGDPTNQTGIPAATGLGWVNFSPPLTAGTVSIDDEIIKKYYLVGALAILPFKDRLVFFKPWIQSTDGSAPIQLIDVALWSWNGTPYYSEPTPINETEDPTAYYVDQTGKGGWLSAGIDQSIVTVSPNEDVLLVGFTGKQTRFVYTGNDLFPFLFYIINSELGSAATFSGVNLDRGALTFGLNGLALTSQVGAERIDLDIPTQVFQLQGKNNSFAAQRISAARDFYREWIYFTFVPNNSMWSFPTLTLQYNYREATWGIHYENFTAHGLYRAKSGLTWATLPYRTWNVWREAWNSGSSTALFPSVVAGTPQGFVVIKGDGTGEAPTGYISAIQNASGLVQITSKDHCVAINDYLYFQGSIGTTYINNTIAQVNTIIDANNFVVDIPFQAGTYLGLGVFTRLIQPLIQTKQFAPYWNEGRQVRLSVQKYLLDYTDQAQVTLNIYLSQNPDTPYNDGSIVPDTQSLNNSLVYSDVLFTSPEANNLNTPTAASQYQIWHRMNTSLIGESFQLGITLNDAQMRNLDFATAEITLHAIQIDIDKSGYNA